MLAAVGRRIRLYLCERLLSFSSTRRARHLKQQITQEELPLLHWPKGALQLDLVEAAGQVRVLRNLVRVDALVRLTLQHLVQQMARLQVGHAAQARLELPDRRIRHFERLVL